MSGYETGRTSGLVFNVETLREDVERQFVLLVRHLLMPIIEAMSRQPDVQRPDTLLILLIGCIEDLASGFASSVLRHASLSMREVSIVLMVKHGWSNEDIAAYLQLAPETIKTHRRNIRKKLGITGTRQTLHEYLQSLVSQDRESSST